MTESESAGAARRAAILEAATGVFLRYGFKKTSMDDLARAAGLSRQGLYLHFATKEALFKQFPVLQLIEAIRAAGRAALAREDVSIEERLLGAFEAGHAHALGPHSAEHMNELLAASEELLGPAVAEMEEGVVANVARALRSAGVAARWKNGGYRRRSWPSCSTRRRCTGQAPGDDDGRLREQVRAAVRIVCRGAQE